MSYRIRRLSLPSSLCIISFLATILTAPAQVDLGNRRELFVDHFLVERLDRALLMLHEPRDEGSVLHFCEPWEGPFSGYCTVIQNGTRYLLYYRGKQISTADGQDEVTCVAESSDGQRWTKPALGLFEICGTRSNNVVLAASQFSHNFSPMLDANPAANPSERFKAIAGTARSGLAAFGSPDGLKWRKLREDPVLTTVQAGTPNAFDSQNVAFWSPAEQRYLMFFRVFHEKKRRIARAESHNFLAWTNLTLMEYRGFDGKPAVLEQLYTSQTHPYFRAPHLYVSLAARFFPGRQVLTEAQAKDIGIHPKYFKDTSDAIFMTTRGERFFDRTFMSAFIRPGIGPENWVSRTTYPALNVVQTGEHEMSAYVNQNYAQPTAHLRRYSMRLDGFASVRAPHEGGEMRTKPFKFAGSRLFLNFATSAAGSIRVEILDQDDKPLPGFTLDQCAEAIGNEIERPVVWKSGSHLGQIAGRTVRLRFAMKDGDLYALRFD